MRQFNHSSRFIEMFGDLSRKPLLDIATSWDKGQPFKKDSIIENGARPCIHYGELYKYGPIIDTVVSLTNEVAIKKSKTGDILFPASDVTPYGLARCSALMIEGVLLGGDIIVLRISKDNSPEYVSYAINMQQDQLIRRVTGSVVRHMSAKSLKTVDIPIPSLDAQLQFVSLIRQADKSKFIGFKSRFIEMFGDTLKNTKDWEFSRLPEVTTIVLGTTPSSSNPDYWDGDIKWITPAELDGDSFVLTDSERHITEEGVKNAGLKSFPAGTVIFSTRAPIGKTAIAGCEMYCNQGFKNFICSDALNPVYLFYTLRVHKEELQKMGTGSTFLELSKKTIENISVSVPDRSLQDEFEVIYKQADKSKYLN